MHTRGEQGSMRARRSAVSNAMGWACLHALVLGGCGGKSLAEVPLAQRDTSAIFGGGTRLKAHYLDGGGGARARGFLRYRVEDELPIRRKRERAISLPARDAGLGLFR